MALNEHNSADPRESRVARLHPKLYIVLHVLSGVVFTALLVWGFAQIADNVVDSGRLTRVDLALSRWVERHSTEWGETLFSYVSWLGAPVLVAVLAIAVGTFAYKHDRLRALTVGLTGASAAALNFLLKQLFHRGRPEYATEFIKHRTWSFPSGHAMDSLAGYGILLVVLLELTHSLPRRRLLKAGAVVLIAAIGVSRIYLGVHYLTDVLGGWLAGGAWLGVCVTAYAFAKRNDRLTA